MKTVDVVITQIPKQPHLQQPDFDVLKQQIEAKERAAPDSVDLREIRSGVVR
jgi:hypothetical protein